MIDTQVLIVGAGAMGSLFASHLADGGAQVWAFDQWREHVGAINDRGLIVRRAGTESTVRINATTDAAAAGRLFDQLEAFIKLAGGSQGLTLTEEAYGGTTITTLDLGGLGGMLEVLVHQKDLERALELLPEHGA